MGVKPCGSCGLCSTRRVWLSAAPSSLSMNTDLRGIRFRVGLFWRALSMFMDIILHGV